MTYFRLIFAALLLCLSVPIQAMAQENGLKKSALHPHCRHAILERAKFEKTCVSNIKSGACSKIKAWIQKTDEYLEQHCSVPSTYLYGVEDLIPDIDVEDVIEGLDDEIDDIDPNSEDKPNDEEPDENGGDSDESGDEVDDNPPERCITGENASTGITEYGEEHPAEIGTANRDARGYACFKKPLDKVHSINASLGLSPGHASFTRYFKIPSTSLDACAAALSGNSNRDSCQYTTITPIQEERKAYKNCLEKEDLLEIDADQYILQKSGNSVRMILGSRTDPYAWRNVYNKMKEKAQQQGWKHPNGWDFYPDNQCNLDANNGRKKTTPLDLSGTFKRCRHTSKAGTPDTGDYITTSSTSVDAVSLPGKNSDYNCSCFTFKEDARDVEIMVEESTASPWFGKSGGGVQYQFVSSIGSDAPNMSSIKPLIEPTSCP